MKKYLLLPLLFFGLVANAQRLAKVDALIKTEMSAQQIPALAVAVIDSGQVIHLSVDGYKDLDSKWKADESTAFHIASVSKTVLCMAVFQLVERGMLDLNTDINEYLPFKVVNPHFPTDIITPGALLIHRSGILDDYEVYQPFWKIPKGDPAIGLQAFLQDYLERGGKFYNDAHFETEEGPFRFKYSNTGFALLGLIVETVAGMDLERYCQQYIFEPLGMQNTSWFLRYLDTSQIAKTYSKSEAGKLVFKGFNGYPDYPAGQLRTSISDFAKLISGYLNADEENFILKRSTINTITPSPGISHKGFYTWFLRSIHDTIHYVHSGGDLGVRTITAIDVRSKDGVIIFANAEVDLDGLLGQLIARLR